MLAVICIFKAHKPVTLARFQQMHSESALSSSKYGTKTKKSIMLAVMVYNTQAVFPSCQIPSSYFAEINESNCKGSKKWNSLTIDGKLGCTAPSAILDL